MAAVESESSFGDIPLGPPLSKKKSTSTSSSGFGALYSYVPPSAPPQIAWTTEAERSGHMLYVTGEWFDSKGQKKLYTYADELYVMYTDKIAVRNKNNDDITTFKCNPCEHDNGIWKETDISETGTTDLRKTINGVEGLKYVNGILREISQDTHSQRYIAFTKDEGESNRKIYYSGYKDPSTETHPSALSHSGYYNNLDYRSLFDDSAPPIHHYENGLQLAQVHSNQHYEDGEYYNGLILGGVIGGGSIVAILVVFCVGLAFGMLICFGYQQKKALEERKKEDWRQDDV
eukprot:432900_1